MIDHIFMKHTYDQSAYYATSLLNLELGDRSFACDQIHLEIELNQTFIWELWSFKVSRSGGHNDPFPELVGLKYNVVY